MRVVSLVPSSTETLLALGAEVVACTKFCEQPDIAHVGGTKNPDLAAIVALEPDLVVLDREENRSEDHDALVEAGMAVFVSAVTDVDGALAVVRDLADAVGVLAADSVRPRTASPTVPRTAFVPIWRRPWMTIGAATYGASILGELGIDVVTFGDVAYPTIDIADVTATSPDLVLVPSEPYDFSNQHLDELAAAVPDATITRVDGRDLFWWGIRTPAALTRLTTALAPRPKL